MTPPASTDLPASRTSEAVYAGLLALASVMGAFLAQRTKLAVFIPLAGLSAWAGLAAVSRLVRSVRPAWRWPIFTLTTVALVAVVARILLPPAIALQGEPLATLQFATVVIFLAAFGLHFAATYGFALVRQSPAQRNLKSLLPLVRLVSYAHAATGVVLLLRLYTAHNFLPGTALVFAGVVLALVLEAVIRAIANLYQPKRLRTDGEPFGRSVLLPALFGEAGPLRSLAATVEKSLGTQLGDTWLLQLTRRWLAPFALFGILGLLASTGVSRVPVEGKGVLIRCGAFAEKALDAGLHFHAPWPFARVEIVLTERIQEVALGFERDLAGPVLWTEKHFEGEQNLLVGQGEELLTIDAPVHYRIRDAVAYLRHTGDARLALGALGYRQLLRLTGQHTSFGLMTTDRGEIANALRTGLQSDCDRLKLGIEIVFVGLKDVHPPVAVAPAYQDVVSAEEERLTIYDRAVTETVDSLAGARTESMLRRLQADTFATERRSRAEGEAIRFLEPLPIFRLHAEVYSTRVRLETLEAVLAPVRQLLLLPASQRGRAQLYLTPDATATFPTLPR